MQIEHVCPLSVAHLFQLSLGQHPAGTRLLLHLREELLPRLDISRIVPPQLERHLLFRREASQALSSHLLRVVQNLQV